MNGCPRRQHSQRPVTQPAFKINVFLAGTRPAAQRGGRQPCQPPKKNGHDRSDDLVQAVGVEHLLLPGLEPGPRLLAHLRQVHAHDREGHLLHFGGGIGGLDVELPLPGLDVVGLDVELPLPGRLLDVELPLSGRLPHVDLPSLGRLLHLKLLRLKL